MSRTTGPRLRIIRRLGQELPGLTTKSMTRRPNPPGQAAAGKRAPKVSEYGLRLKEKQKLRFHYGLTERSLRRLYDNAYRMSGDTGRNLLSLLESRFDNLVWRAGFTRTIPEARQLIAHGHVDLDGRRAKTAGQLVSTGSVIKLRDRARNRESIKLTANAPLLDRPAGVKADLDQMSVTIEALPGPEQVPFPVDIQKVIEYFAK